MSYQDIILTIITAVVAASAIRTFKAVGVKAEDVNQAINFAGAVVRSLEETYPGATMAGEAKFNEAVARLMERFGIDREAAAVYVQAGVSGLRQAGIKPQHAATQLAQIDAGRRLQEQLNAAGMNGSKAA